MTMGVQLKAYRPRVASGREALRGNASLHSDLRLVGGSASGGDSG
jgi:hypothetical protein